MNGTTGARILVVEDFGPLRTLVLRVLTGEGHEVVGVGSAVGAIARLRNASFDVLVTDYSVAGGRGTEIARHAVTTNPTMGVLFTSDNPALARGPKHVRARTGFLLKPFDIDALVAAVRGMIVPAAEREANAPVRSSTALGEVEESASAGAVPE